MGVWLGANGGVAHTIPIPMHVPMPLLICLLLGEGSSSLEIRSYVYPQFRLFAPTQFIAQKGGGIFRLFLFFLAVLQCSVMKMLFISWHSHAQLLLKERAQRKNAKRQTQLGTSNPFSANIQVSFRLKFTHSLIYPEVRHP